MFQAKSRTNRQLNSGGQRRRLHGAAIALLAFAALVLAACGGAAEPVAQAPTQVPAAAPTDTPAAAPSAAPSSEPSAVPSSEPSAVPSSEPSAVPTAEPSAVPTSEPTAAPTSAPSGPTPSVTVSGQALANGGVVIAGVVSAGPGWLVVHADNGGKPGVVLGYTAVPDGSSQNVAVKLDLSKATGTLYAMLHIDAGTLGTYEFPGADAPATVDGRVVSPAFQLQALSGEAEVELEDFQIRPQVLVIRAGTTVKFANKDEAMHTVTSDTKVFDSGAMGKGDRFTFTFTQPGVYPYYCAPHGGPGGQGMAATIIVLP